MSACVELRRARPLLGTLVEVEIAAATRAAGDTAIDAAFAAVARVHALMSFHEPDSDVSRLNRGAAVRLHPWTAAVLDAAEEFRRVSGGVFDVAVAPWLQARGVLPEMPLSARSGEREGPNAKRWEGEVCFRDFGGKCPSRLPTSRVRLPPGAGIDLGGIAKGFAVDRAVDALRGAGIARGLVNAGGDLFAFGAPQPVALRDPRTPGAVLGRIAVDGRALAFSAAAQPGAAPSEIVDPATGAAARGVLGASVLARDGLTADALTKLVMLQGRGVAPVLARYGAEALFVDARGRVHATSGWPAALDHAA